MKYVCRIIGTLLFFVASLGSFAQTSNDNFKIIDEYVKSLGPLDTLNMGTISYIVTKKFPDNKDKVRAIFDWITYNISYDLKAGRNNDNEKTNTENVLKTRMATAKGYAGLFQDMCSVIKIRCLTVDGYAKYKTEDINEKPDEFNHTWDVVQLGQSPDSWYYVDPTWGSGYTDEKMKLFTKYYNDAYFFADRTIFNAQHFPDNSAWQLGPGPKSTGSFFSQPLVKSAAYEFGLGKFSPDDGNIKAKLNKAFSFSLMVNPDAAIQIVSMEMGEDKRKKTKTMDYTFSRGTISFNYKFETADEFPITILVNNKPLLSYLVEVSE